VRRIALLGDVHANLPALEAVLAHARRQGVEAVWNTGDFVGYGAFPDQVVQLLRRRGALSIIGNYDLKVLKFRRKRDRWRQSKHPLKFFAFQWASEQLSKKSRKYLRALPQELRLEAAGKQVLLTHGSPASNEEALTPNTPQARLRELARLAQADLVVCGHSHQPFAREIDGALFDKAHSVWFINTGSVGRPDDGDPRACYAILSLEPGHFQVQHYRLEYDVERAVAEIRAQGLPEAFAQMMLQGRPLDMVLDKDLH
jgi:putative phosphoesterase